MVGNLTVTPVAYNRWMSDYYGYHFNGDYIYDESVGPRNPHRTRRVDEWTEHPLIEAVLREAEAIAGLRRLRVVV